MNSWDLYLHANDGVNQKQNKTEAQAQQSFQFGFALPDKVPEKLSEIKVQNKTKDKPAKVKASVVKSPKLLKPQPSKLEHSTPELLMPEPSKSKRSKLNISRNKSSTELKLESQVIALNSIEIKNTETVLPLNAWSIGELSEIRCNKKENIFHLLLPLLSELSSQNRWITLIAPPAGIDKKLFAYHGIDVSKVLLIHPKENIDDTSTMNKALKNGTSGIVIIWVEELASRFVAQWRKSVKQGHCRGIIINHDRREHSSSSVALSLDVSSSNNAITMISSQMFGRKSSYRAKRSFPIINIEESLMVNMNVENFCLIN